MAAQIFLKIIFEYLYAAQTKTFAVLYDLWMIYFIQGHEFLNAVTVELIICFSRSFIVFFVAFQYVMGLF